MFVNVLKLYQYKTKRSETKPYPFYLENIFKCFAANNTKKKKKKKKKKKIKNFLQLKKQKKKKKREKKKWLNGYAYNFSVDYNIIDTSIIISIQIYLMKNNDIK